MSGDPQKIREFITRLIDDTNSKRIVWDWIDHTEDGGKYYTDYDDEYHLFFRVGIPKGTSLYLMLYEIDGVPIGEINDHDKFSELYDAILSQGEATNTKDLT